jgi:hypothetical protein
MRDKALSRFQSVNLNCVEEVPDGRYEAPRSRPYEMGTALERTPRAFEGECGLPGYLIEGIHVVEEEMLARITEEAESTLSIQCNCMASAYAVVKFDLPRVPISVGIVKEETDPGHSFQAVDAIPV